MSSTPEVRFDRFADAWEQRKVSEVAEITAGGTPSTSISSYWEPKEIPWLSSGEVHKKYIFFTDNKISTEGMNNSSARIIKENSVLIALAGQGKTRGTVAINRIPLTTNQSIAAMTFSDDIVPEFVFCNLDGRYEEIRKMSSGDGARGGLNKQIVGDIEIPYTTKPEQEQIGHFFNHIDNLITLHQRKYDKLIAMKAACLDKMFPKNGNKVPELRLAGFTGDWEQHKLEEIITEKLSNGIINKPGNEDSAVRHINVSNMYVPDRIHPKDLSKSSHGTDIVEKCNVEYGDIFMTRSSVKPEGIAEANVLLDTGVYVFDDHLIRMKVDKSKYDPMFVKICLKNKMFKTQFITKSKTTAFTTIGQDDITSCEGLFPSFPEQKAIKGYFERLDNLIALHQRKLDKLQQLKQAMLHKMFV